MEYRMLTQKDVRPGLFAQFIRRQVVTKCFRRVNGEWLIKDAPFIDDWNEDEYRELIACLRGTLKKGGAVFGAFENGMLKGFASVEAEHIGPHGEYADLTSIHVSEDMRGRGAGRELFGLACDFARSTGAAKLYISAHSAVESQAFYESMGCVDAKWLCPHHVEAEPFDRQLELTLGADTAG